MRPSGSGRGSSESLTISLVVGVVDGRQKWGEPANHMQHVNVYLMLGY